MGPRVVSGNLATSVRHDFCEELHLNMLLTKRQSAPASSTSRAWIAGAVIGPVAGISLILLGMFLLRHRRLTKNRTPHESNVKTNEKPELHADSLPAPRVYEMDGMQN
jgi:nitrate reductase gamma subunit